MVYKSMLTPKEVRSYIRRLKEEEGGETDYCKRLVRDFLKLAKKIDVRISTAIMHEEVKDNGAVDNYIQYKVMISRKHRKGEIKIPLVIGRPSESILRQPDLSDVLLQIRTVTSFTPKNFKEYCEGSGKSMTDPTSKTDYQKQVKMVGDLKKIINEKEVKCLPKSSSMSDVMEESLIKIDDIADYNRLIDLRDQVERYRRLLSQYGYDLNTGELDTSSFPVAKTDSELEGIGSDIEEYNDRAKAYNEFLKHVVKKYNDGFFDKHEKYFFTIPELKINKKNMVKNRKSRRK